MFSCCMFCNTKHVYPRINVMSAFECTFLIIIIINSKDDRYRRCPLNHSLNQIEAQCANIPVAISLSLNNWYANLDVTGGLKHP